MKHKPPTIFVVPKPGLRVRNPDGSYFPIPPDGARVPRNGYWLGQIRDGSVTVKAAPTARSKTTTPARHVTKPST